MSPARELVARVEFARILAAERPPEQPAVKRRRGYKRTLKPRLPTLAAGRSKAHWAALLIERAHAESGEPCDCRVCAEVRKLKDGPRNR